MVRIYLDIFLLILSHLGDFFFCSCRCIWDMISHIGSITVKGQKMDATFSLCTFELLIFISFLVVFSGMFDDEVLSC